MEIMVTPRMGGKTTAAIKHSAETGAVIITQNIRMAGYIKDMARKMELEIPEPMSYRQALDGGLLGSKEGVIVEDAEILIQHLFRGKKVEMITMSWPECPTLPGFNDDAIPTPEDEGEEKNE